MEEPKHMSGVDCLLKLNRQHSLEFDRAALKRRQYRAAHPTEILAMKCMDGRLHLPIMTKTPLGIIQPLRNLGGKFSLGWPYLVEKLKEWMRYAVDNGRDGLVLVTYHFAKGDTHRGCRGFDYNKEASVEATLRLKKEFDDVFGDRTAFCALLVGIETDDEALIFHGDNPAEVLDLGDMLEASEDDVRKRLAALYPDMPRRIMADLLPLAFGNIERVREVRASNRPVLDSEHREWVLGLGRGFDWLHTINMALLVGPFSPNLSEPIETGIRLIWGNFTDGRIDRERGIVIMACAPYRDAAGPERIFAEKKARFLEKLARDLIAGSPDLREMIPHVHYLTGVTDMTTRKFHQLS